MLLYHDHTVLHSHPASKKTYTSSTDVFPSDVTPSSFSSATTFSFSSSSPSLPSPLTFSIPTATSFITSVSNPDHRPASSPPLQRPNPLQLHPNPLLLPLQPQRRQPRRAPHLHRRLDRPGSRRPDRPPPPLRIHPPGHLLLPLTQRRAEPRRRADPPALPEKDKRHGAHEHGEPREEGASAGDAEAAEERGGGEGEERGEEGAGARGGGVGGGGEDFVGVG